MFCLVIGGILKNNYEKIKKHRCFFYNSFKRYINFSGYVAPS